MLGMDGSPNGSKFFKNRFLVATFTEKIAASNELQY